MRIAYLITSYALPDQVLRLSAVLRRGSQDAEIVVHHDDRRCSLDRAALEALGARLVEPASAVEWGEASQLEMVLRCLRWMLERVDFDWLVLLSGQDYPIRPVGKIERSLAAADVDAFIETRPCDPPGLFDAADEFAARYFYRWRRLRSVTLGRIAQAVARWTPSFATRAMPSGTWLGVRSLNSPFGAGLICHRGSDWLTLSRRGVQVVDRFINSRPDVLRYYRRTLIPTESFVHTVLANDQTVRLSGDYSRYMVFDSVHTRGPRVLRMEDVDGILASGANFARKFDETVDRAVLDEIDRRIHES